MKSKIVLFCKLLSFLIIVLAITVACGGNNQPPSEGNIGDLNQQAEVAKESATAEIEPTIIEFVPTETLESTEVLPTSYPTQTPSPTVRSEPNRVEMGEVSEFGGYSFAAVSIQDPAEPGLFFESREGMRLVALEVIVGNVFGKTFSSNVLNATLVDDNGFIYAPELAAVDDQLELIEVQPGERVFGWIPFFIPSDAAPAVIKYQFSDFPKIELESNISFTTDESISVLDIPLTMGESLTKSFTPMGEVVEQDGYSLVAEAIEDPATPTEFFEPKAGEKLVAVQITVGNVSGKVFSSNVLSAYLIDDNGFVYSAELGGRDEQLELVELGPGERVRGWVSFSIPEESIPTALKFQMSGYPLLELYTGLSLNGIQSDGQSPTETPPADVVTLGASTPEEKNNTVTSDRIIGTWSGLQTSKNNEKVPAEWQFLEGGVMVIRIPAGGISFGANWTLEGKRINIITEIDPDNPTYRDVEFITDDVMRLTKDESDIVETWTRVSK